MTTASQAAPRPYAGIIQALRRHRLMVSTVTVLYLVTYLWSIGDIVITATDQSRVGAVPALQVAAGWPAKLLRQTAPFSYEPVLAARPSGYVQLFLAPVNVALGLLLGGLAGANLAAAVRLYRTTATCRRRSFASAAAAGLALGVSETVAYEYLAAMREYGFAEVTGGGRSSGWCLQDRPQVPEDKRELVGDSIAVSRYTTLEDLA